MNLHTLATWANEIATAHGFDVPTWENLPIKLMFVVTEIDELHEEIMNIHNGSVSEELADVAIRTLAVLGALWPEQWSQERTTERSIRTHFHDRPEVLLWPMLHQLRVAIGHWRQDEKRDTMICLELVILEIWRVSDRLGIDLFLAIDDKMRINAGREQLHGKKRSEA